MRCKFPVSLQLRIVWLPKLGCCSSQESKCSVPVSPLVPYFSSCALSPSRCTCYTWESCHFQQQLWSSHRNFHASYFLQTSTPIKPHQFPISIGPKGSERQFPWWCIANFSLAPSHPTYFQVLDILPKKCRVLPVLQHSQGIKPTVRNTEVQTPWQREWHSTDADGTKELYQQCRQSWYVSCWVPCAVSCKQLAQLIFTLQFLDIGTSLSALKLRWMANMAAWVSDLLSFENLDGQASACFMKPKSCFRRNQYLCLYPFIWAICKGTVE